MNASGADTATFVAYLRVSTAEQGKSGLGLEAQRATVELFVRSRGGRMIGPEFVEIESGKHNDRPQLQAALKRCKLTGATLCVAKLDRLSRSAAFLMTLRDSGVPFVAADVPEANTMTIGVMSVMAQYEREVISTRTKAALAAARARGTKLGGRRANGADIRDFAARGQAASQARARAFAAELGADLERLRADGLSLNAIASRLNQDGIRTPRRGAWTATAVRRVLARL
jgi:DNA invertase Pin-like site-specific DNA recombinase